MVMTYCNIISYLVLPKMVMMSEAEIENIRTELFKNVGKNIQRIREEKGISQSDLVGKMIGDYNVPNVSRLESGKNNPTLFTLYRIAKALDVKIEDLVVVEY